MSSWPERYRGRGWRRLALLLAALAVLPPAQAQGPVVAPAPRAAAAQGPAGAAAPPAAAAAARFGFGRTPTSQQIDAWDIDVRPDGHGVRRGRGSVQQGQAIYDEQCAQCHGTFGESNAYIVLAGGVDQADLATGRAKSLLRGEVRTVGNKLNSAATLWDYIHRAMPWNAPQSLSVDQVYAVTAYVLFLNEIVAEDFTLSDANLVQVPMPNRNGFTRAHGMGSVSGKPDVQGSACMSNCAPPPRVASTLPDFARNAHGNLAEQKRPLGPFRGIDTTRYEPAGRAPVAPAASATARPPAARDLAAAHACTACHGLEQKVVGPAFAEVAARYAGRADAVEYLMGTIRAGGAGRWGPTPMPPQAALSEAELRTLATWVLGGAR